MKKNLNLTFESDPILESMIDSAQKAGEHIMQKFGQQNQISYKSSHQDFATNVDRESQSIIANHIVSALQEAGITKEEVGFIGEEGLEDLNGKFLFSIDPIDGTTNFATGIPYFAVSISGFENGELLYGVIYDPIWQNLYVAQRGKGAYKISKELTQKLEIVPRPLNESMLATYIHTKPELARKTLLFLEKHAIDFRGVRVMGAGVPDFCRLTENIFQICHFQLAYLWDFSASKVLVEEAGGQMLNLNFEEMELHLDQPKSQYNIWAGHPETLKRFIELVKE